MRNRNKAKIRLVRNEDGSLKAVSYDKGTLKTATSPQQTHTIVINIPAIKIPFYRTLRRLPKKYVALAVLALLAITTAWPLQPNTRNPSVTTKNNASAAQIKSEVRPDYAVMSPKGDGVESLGGYAQINPPGEPKVYAYADKISGVPIKVSQQKMPANIGQDNDKLRSVAEQFNATELIEFDNKSAFIGQSVNGPQSVIYSHEGILVLIASDQKIQNEDWAEYLRNLRF